MSDRKRSRGLALSAVSALTITGLTFTPSAALAEPGDAVVMLSQLDGKASVRQDDSDSNNPYVSLVAARRDPTATISFEVNSNPEAGDDTAGWTAIQLTPTLTGNIARISWNARSFVGSTVSLRAVATTADDEPTYSTVTGVAVTGDPIPGATAPNSVTVANFGTTKGYFRQPYASSQHTATQLVVSGSSSATQGSVDLSWWRSSDGTFRGDVDAVLTPDSYKSGTSDTYPPNGRFSTVLDITGYDAEAADDVLAVRGVRDSDDVTPFAVYEQSIGSARASGPSDGSSRHPSVNVYVTDTNDASNVVAGAEVRRLSDQSLVGYTDDNGGVIAVQDAGTTETYYVNTTDTDAYEADVDVITDEVTTPEYVPTVTDVAPVLADGNYFDDDEYSDGDIALQLVDQEGKPIAVADEEISYSLHDKGTTAPEPTVATTDATGKVVIPFNPDDSDGAHVLQYNAPANLGGAAHDPIELVSGDSTLTLTPDRAGGTAPSGGQVTYTGHLNLDGVPLANRSIDLTYGRGTESSPGTAADAGIVVGDDRLLTTTVMTNDDGEFTVTVADPIKAGRPGEAGGTLTATATAAQETASVTTTFTVGAPAAAQPPAMPKAPITVKLKLTGSSNGRAADKLKVAGTTGAAGRRIRVYARVGLGHWKLVATKRLDRAGRASLTMTDRNGTKATRYRVQLPASASVPASTSNVKHLR